MSLIRRNKKKIHSDDKKMSILANSMRLAIGCIFFLLVSTAQAQLLDLAKTEYLYVPGSSGNFEYHRQAAELNVPFKLKEGKYFFAGLDYSRLSFRFQEEEDSYNKKDTEDFTSLDLNLTYTAEIKNDWRFAIQVAPSLNSNFIQRVAGSDFLLNSVVVFIKNKEDAAGRKLYRLIFGLGYTTTSRFPGPFPFINYHRQFHPKWSYTIGAPYSNIQFHASTKSRFKIHAEGEAFNVNIQQGLILENDIMANRLRVLLINIGFRYEYKFSQYIESYFVVAQTVQSSLQLRDEKEVVFEPPLDQEMFFRLGVRCKI